MPIANNETMLALGDFHFSIETSQFQTLKTSYSWRWKTKERYGQKAARQFHGSDAITKSWDITIYPRSKKDLVIIDKIKALGDSGEPLRLVGGTPTGGADMGRWVLERLSTDETHFLTNGIPLEIKGSISIAEYAEDA
jgi:phage protein U